MQRTGSQALRCGPFAAGAGVPDTGPVLPSCRGDGAAGMGRRARRREGNLLIFLFVLFLWIRLRAVGRRAGEAGTSRRLSTDSVSTAASDIGEMSPESVQNRYKDILQAPVGALALGRPVSGKRSSAGHAFDDPKDF